jgi:hypothetical protein
VRITKPGKDIPAVGFACEYCECEFECTVGEYEVKVFQTDHGYTEQNAEHRCPGCGVLCRKRLV